ncbi:MAG: endonuclease III domain-containing protein [Fibrobacterota bacterium]
MSKKKIDIDEAVCILRKEIKALPQPAVTRIAARKDPFRVLISTVLSLRTKDSTTIDASLRLFEKASDIYKLAAMPQRDLEKIIYPVGFYRVKAANILKICSIIIDKYKGRVPDTLEELLKLPGVGRKTANLVITLGFGKPGICVDIHVHRISNRFGITETEKPDETEFRLREILPKKYWIEYNDLLVTWGQNICTPVSPRCSVCALFDICPALGVRKKR